MSSADPGLRASARNKNWLICGDAIAGLLQAAVNEIFCAHVHVLIDFAPRSEIRPPWFFNARSCNASSRPHVVKSSNF